MGIRAFDQEPSRAGYDAATKEQRQRLICASNEKGSTAVLRPVAAVTLALSSFPDATMFS